MIRLATYRARPSAAPRLPVRKAVTEALAAVEAEAPAGPTLSGTAAQALLAIDWRGHPSKDEFVQSQSPFLLALGRPVQRSPALAAA